MTRPDETWEFLDTDTAILTIGGRRLAITTARGGPSPEAWWAELWRTQRLAEWEAAAGERLEAMSDEERTRLARMALDDGTSGGGWLLLSYLRRCQSRPVACWPGDVRLAMLRAVARRTRMARVKAIE